jgi:hypothetical protein
VSWRLGLALCVSSLVALAAVIGELDDRGYIVRIEPGVTARLSPADVERITYSLRPSPAGVHPDARIASIRLTSNRLVSDLDVGAAQRAEPFWLVRFEGRFPEQEWPRPRHRSFARLCTDYVEYVLADATGDLLAITMAGRQC